MQIDEILAILEEHADQKALEGMAKYGITPANAYGVKLPVLRQLARQLEKDHQLAKALWQINNRETRILASMVDQPSMVTETQVDAWARTFDYWEICDQCCMNLFEKLPFAYDKALELSRQEGEFVKRSGYVLMARLAVSDKAAPDEKFIDFFPQIKAGARDERNYVKKAVSWALRQIGKRSLSLHSKALAWANAIDKLSVTSAHWIAKDVRRELNSEKIIRRLRARS